MGRTAQPAALKLIKGRGDGKDTAGRPVNQGPAFKRLPPNPPSWLSREAAAEWKRVVPGLSRLDLLKPEDRAGLAAYCEAWATFVQATRTVQEEGQVIEARQGRLAHPCVGIARNAGREMRSWAAHFGLTPSTEQAL